ncbi:alpha-tocopherol transfer protein-like [Contarinia nasturtii]|uniref:alpha-tocopherol transfer protein-like n=1 Tax=Contarinia nasturtii TaxID=265458 RepID=UPI0012D4204E|nr:alpha-tocopherol transfer protein-like [Contarinia nasturtii]
MSLKLACCEDQYKKFPQLDRDEVLKLQDWHEKQPHLPNITELDAIIFLHACNYSVEKAKICMDTYYTIRTHCPEFFGQRDVNGHDITAQMNILAVAPLEGLTHEGYRAILCKLTDFDASKYNYVDSAKLFSMVADLLLAQDGIAEGHAIIIDMEGSTLSHLAKVNILAMKKFMFYIQEALPVRLRAFHFINTVPFMDKVLALMKPFMKKELLDAMHLHSSLDTFVDKHVPKMILPSEYGGSAGTLKEFTEKTYKELRANPEFFVNEEKNRVDEKLRPGKPKTESDLFGTDGNFKQLQFD